MQGNKMQQNNKLKVSQSSMGERTRQMLYLIVCKGPRFMVSLDLSLLIMMVIMLIIDENTHTTIMRLGEVFIWATHNMKLRRGVPKGCYVT